MSTLTVVARGGIIGAGQETYRIHVRHYDDMFDLIEKGGYKYVDRQIGLGTFRMEGGMPYHAELVVVDLIDEHSYESLRLDAALERLRERGLVPATAHEMLAFGAQHPDMWNKNRHLQALGTMMRHRRVGEYRFVLSIRFGEKRGRRDLNLFRMESVDDGFHAAWTASHQFLVVKRRYLQVSS